MSLFDLYTMPMEEMFQGFFLPLIIIFVITWGILGSLRLFKKRVNIVLSLALALLASATPQFTTFATYTMQWSANWALIAFALVFGFGTLMWMYGSARGIYFQMTDKEYQKVNKDLEKLYREYRATRDEAKRRSLMERIDKLKMKRDLA